MLENVADEYGLTGCTILARDVEDRSADDGPLACFTADPDEEEVRAAAIDLATVMATEYQRLALTPSTITYQPDGDWALVSMDFIVLTDPAPQTLTTELFGFTISVRSTPVSYQWDFGDGTPPLTTSDPGQPYPHQTVSHVYTSATDAVTVSLTTTWRGEFQIEGMDTWLPIAGLVSTTSNTGPVEIVAMEVHLVPNQG